jgi:type IV pilus assembly protein PilV
MNKKLTLSRCRGMAMLEVMIAAVVIGIALLGIAAMQVSSIQGASNALFRSQAIDLAASLADRIRANQGADNSYVSAAATNCIAPNKVCSMVPTEKEKPDDCVPTELAANDLWEVRCMNGVRNRLPGGTMTVTCTDNDAADGDVCSDNSPFQIDITWQAQKSVDVDDANRTQNVSLTIIPGGRI